MFEYRTQTVIARTCNSAMTLSCDVTRSFGIASLGASRPRPRCFVVVLPLARGVFALCARVLVFVDDVTEERFEVFADLGRATTSLGVSSDLNFASAVHKK